MCHDLQQCCNSLQQKIWKCQMMLNIFCLGKCRYRKVCDNILYILLLNSVARVALSHTPEIYWNNFIFGSSIYKIVVCVLSSSSCVNFFSHHFSWSQLNTLIRSPIPQQNRKLRWKDFHLTDFIFEDLSLLLALSWITHFFAQNITTTSQQTHTVT